jgi:hypothetical protein
MTVWNTLEDNIVLPWIKTLLCYSWSLPIHQWIWAYLVLTLRIEASVYWSLGFLSVSWCDVAIKTLRYVCAAVCSNCSSSTGDVLCVINRSFAAFTPFFRILKQVLSFWSSVLRMQVSLLRTQVSLIQTLLLDPEIQRRSSPDVF